MPRKRKSARRSRRRSMNMSKPTRRRATAHRATRGRSRGRGRGRGGKLLQKNMMFSLQDIAMGVVGTVIAAQLSDNATLSKTVKDPGMRYGLLTLGAGMLAIRVPALRALAVGVGIGTGYRFVAAKFPKLLPIGQQGAAADMTAAAMRGAGTIGRHYDANEVQRLRADARPTWPALAGFTARPGVLTGERQSVLTGPGRRPDLLRRSDLQFLPAFM